MNVVGIGYQGRSVEEVCVALLSDGISIVCDVRLTPLSRKPGLSKKALSSALASVGLGYRHFPALGNPKWNRSGFAGDVVELRVAQQAFVATVLETPEARRALDEIRECSGSQKVALLCFESDEVRCHRSLVIASIFDADRSFVGAW